MNHVGTIVVETERLILRRFKNDDAKQMFENYASREVVTEFLSWLPHTDISQTREYLSNIVVPAYENIETYRWAIELKSNNQLIGCIDVVKSRDDKKQAELGWVLSNDYWGKGLMPEAANAVLLLLFKIGYARVHAVHNVDNPKSGRVMQKIGMEFEGILRKYHKNNKGELIDVAMYSIIKEENVWERKKQGVIWLM